LKEERQLLEKRITSRGNGNAPTESLWGGGGLTREHPSKEESIIGDVLNQTRNGGANQNPNAGMQEGKVVLVHYNIYRDQKMKKNEKGKKDKMSPTMGRPWEKGLFACGLPKGGEKKKKRMRRERQE